MTNLGIKGRGPKLLLLPAVLLMAFGLWLATMAGAENGQTVRSGVYGPDTCDNSKQSIDTRISKAPKGKTKSTKARIEFEAFYCNFPNDEVDQGSFAFTCKVDREKASSCTSPVNLKKLKKGKHVFTVAANFSGGGTGGDPSPAVAKWKVTD